MPKQLKIRNALLCDFVARGWANKHNIVNAISGDVVVPGFPAEVGFGIYAEFEFEGGVPDSLNMEVTLNGEQLLGGEGKPSTPAPNVPGVVSIPRFEFSLNQEAVLELIFSAEGYGRVIALKKRIFAGSVDSIVSQQLSEQFPTAAPDSSSPPAPARRASQGKRRRKKAR